MSIDIERLFSKGRLILSHMCNQLSAGTTCELLCLNNWIEQGLVMPEDLKEAAGDVPMVLLDVENTYITRVRSLEPY